MLQFNTLESFPLSESLSLSLNFLAFMDLYEIFNVISMYFFWCLMSFEWVFTGVIYVFNESKSCLPLRRLQSFHEN